MSQYIFPCALRQKAKAVFLAATLSLAGIAGAGAVELKPYKENLFSYRSVTDSGFGGDFLVVDYSKQRDLRDRDEIDERKVFGHYVSYKPRRSQSSYELKANGRSIKYVGVGKAKGGAKAVVIYIHGQGGNRFQGMNDDSFGGNFNRIKNLMVRNGGAYLSTEFTDFGAAGTQDIAALVAYQKQLSPRAEIVVACGSMGGIICWNLVKNAGTASQLAGIMLLGSPRDPGFLSSGALSRKVPVFMGQGSKDSVYNWEDQANFFKRIKSTTPGYPIKFHLFNTGSHGTPIRMTDWRLVLNWMFAQ
ncbi:alpha/beta hydrolase [Roseibium limicola]|uniref:Alpha/beta hydrolase n=1 Tax=Roseibium limicola TaxID=2816037 RepID=A0A939EMV7_9HYPH|nr:alpha/beta hydrolase [Roseibium limicola]MBO0345357.1 alpha/beta hydrolase [Roseibium limicola]